VEASPLGPAGCIRAHGNVKRHLLLLICFVGGDKPPGQSEEGAGLAYQYRRHLLHRKFHSNWANIATFVLERECSALINCQACAPLQDPRLRALVGSRKAPMQVQLPIEMDSAFSFIELLRRHAQVQPPFYRGGRTPQPFHHTHTRQQQQQTEHVQFATRLFTCQAPGWCQGQLAQGRCHSPCRSSAGAGGGMQSEGHQVQG